MRRAWLILLGAALTVNVWAQNQRSSLDRPRPAAEEALRPHVEHEQERHEHPHVLQLQRQEQQGERLHEDARAQL